MCSILPSLELKLGYRTVGRRKLRDLTALSRFVSETANLAHDERKPYVGSSAFAHKGGLHIDAVRKCARTYEHCEPEKTGNVRRFLISEQSGKSAILEKAAAHRLVKHKDEPEVREVIEQLKQLEFQGYQFEGAEASFELLMLKAYKRHRKLFERAGFRIVSEMGADLPARSEATIKIRVGEQEEHTAAEGDGPVEALDRALRKALQGFYPGISSIELSDYKVRVLDAKAGAAAKVRVHIESTDGRNTWGTVGVSTNIIDASWQALVDSVEYGLLHMPKRGKAK
jgi:2-isopropylmalate synthase